MRFGDGPKTGRGRKMHGKHVFRSDFLVGNFGLPFKKLYYDNFGNFRVGETKNTLTIYIPTEMFRFFW